MTSTNLTACSSGHEARICIFLIPFERKHWSLWNCELNVGENNTIDLLEENTKKKNNRFLWGFFLPPSLKCNRGPKSRHHSGCNSDGVHKRAAVYVQSFRLILEVWASYMTISVKSPRYIWANREGHIYIFLQEYCQICILGLWFSFSSISSHIVSSTFAKHPVFITSYLSIFLQFLSKRKRFAVAQG